MKSLKAIGMGLLMMILLSLCAGAEQTVALPEDIVRIEAEAFYGDTAIAEAVLQEGIIEIGARAFAWSGLKRINLPQSLEVIAADAFKGCDDLTAAVVSGSYAHGFCIDYGIYFELVDSTPVEDFTYTSDGTSVTITKYTGSAAEVVIPSAIDGIPVTKIGKHAFSANKTLKYAYVPEGVVELESSVFYECTNLKEVYLPTTLRAMGITVFYECRNLNDVVLPDGIEKIRDSTFYHCTALTNITVPQSVKLIEYSAFMRCTALQSITLPGVETLGNCAFRMCQNLLEVNLSETLKTIGQQTFDSCGGLRRVLLPRSVTLIENSAFSNSPDISARVYCNSYAMQFCIDNDIPFEIVDSTPIEDFTYTSDGTSVTIKKYTGSAEKVVIPGVIDGMPVTKIGKHAFSTNKTLKQVYVPAGVVELEASVFYQCSNLEKVYLPATLRAIGSTCFYECRNLDNVIIPEGVEKIGNSVFYYCTALTDITVPTSVKLIDYCAFYRCSALQEITLPGVESIGSKSFSSCYNLLKVNLPQTLKSIGQQAFDTCTGLSDVLLARSVNSINNSAFDNCTSISARVYQNSYAQTFCEGNNIPFVVIEE